MLLKNNYRGQNVPVKVSLSLSGMAKQDVSTSEAHAHDSTKPSLPMRSKIAQEDLSKQRSPQSSKTTFEASIDALVDVQLARLAEVLP